MDLRKLRFDVSLADRAAVGSLLFFFGLPLASLPFLALRFTAGPRWLLDGHWFGTVLMAPLLALFAAVILVGPFVHLARPQLERLPVLLRMATATMFFALPWSAITYWLVPKGATGSFAEWGLVVVAPVMLAAVLVERHRSVLLASMVFAMAAVVPLFVVSDVRAPFVTLWTYGGSMGDAFLVIRAAAAAMALGFALTFGASEADAEFDLERIDYPVLFATALAVSALLAAVVAPLLRGRVLFDGAALAMPILVLMSRKSLRLADLAPKIALAQVCGSSLVTTLALISSHGEAAVPAASHGAFAVIVGLALMNALQRTPSLVRVTQPKRR